MATITAQPTGSTSSGEFVLTDPGRAADIERKHRLVAEFLELNGYDALLLQKPCNFSWLTCGADCTRHGSSETTAALFIPPDARVVIASNVDSAQLFDHEFPSLGFQLKERSWHEPRHVLIDDLCRGRTVASDTGDGGTKDVSEPLASLRIPLSEFECDRSRMLGELVAHAVEATARNCRPEQTEAEIAGELSHRLMKHHVIPERIQVWGDDQAQRYPHWSFGSRRIKGSCIVSAIGRRWGLCAGVARTVCFGKPLEDFLAAHRAATLAQATGIFFCKPEWELFEVWNRVKRIYEKFGHPDEWQRSDQAEVIGYHVSEFPVVPKSEFQLSPRTPLFWHPSVESAVVGDTILVTESGFEILTPTGQWPTLRVEVKGKAFERPDVLCRDA